MQPGAEPYYYAEQPPRRGAGLRTAAVVLLTGALGFGTVHFFLQSLRKSESLSANEAALTALRTEVESQKKQIVALSLDREKLTQAEVDLRNARQDLGAAEAKLHDFEVKRAEVDAELAEFHEMTDKFRSMIDGGTLSVVFRRGRMIVALPAGVLFDSGSAELSDEGRKNVVQVATILRGVTNRRFIVAGHTDNVPAVKEYKSNWALGTARAVTVTEALIGAGMDARRLVAAGYAEHDPVATNYSASGRQKNRRIEIVLEPYIPEPPPSAPKR